MVPLDHYTRRALYPARRTVPEYYKEVVLQPMLLGTNDTFQSFMTMLLQDPCAKRSILEIIQINPLSFEGLDTIDRSLLCT